MSNEHAQVVWFEELRRADVPRGTNWHEEHLVRLLKERLARLTVEAPMFTVAVSAVETEPVALPSGLLSV
ncbi:MULTISPECIES: hypothetical protein [Cupriavidus]|uniref:hypothetical protein n=1 Tax=Cupriavidus sp. DF5525 TaxID=3160989 RepID=UPI0032DEE403